MAQHVVPLLGCLSDCIRTSWRVYKTHREAWGRGLVVSEHYCLSWHIARSAELWCAMSHCAVPWAKPKCKIRKRWALKRWLPPQVASKQAHAVWVCMCACTDRPWHHNHLPSIAFFPILVLKQPRHDSTRPLKVCGGIWHSPQIL